LTATLTAMGESRSNLHHPLRSRRKRRRRRGGDYHTSLRSPSFMVVVVVSTIVLTFCDFYGPLNLGPYAESGGKSATRPARKAISPSRSTQVTRGKKKTRIIVDFLQLGPFSDSKVRELLGRSPEKRGKTCFSRRLSGAS
jgi:hypothetical protein